MKRWTILAAAALFLLAADCNKPTEENPPEGGLADPTTAQMLLSIVADNGGYESIYYSSPQGMKGEFDAFGKAKGKFKQGEDLCAPYVSLIGTPDTTDADGDGIPVSVRVSALCDTTVIGDVDGDGMGPDTLRVVMVGEAHFQDPDDADPWTALATLTGIDTARFFYMGVFFASPAGRFEEEAGIDGEMRALHDPGVFRVVDRATFLSRMQMGPMDTTVVYARYAHLRFAPDDTTWTPDSASVVSGDLALSDTVYLNTGGQEQGYIVSTPTPLRLEATCDGDGDGMGGDPISGEVEITDGRHTLLVRWTGCGQRKVFLDGQEFTPPAF